jgi:hypothetical protein
MLRSFLQLSKLLGQVCEASHCFTRSLSGRQAEVQREDSHGQDQRSELAGSALAIDLPRQEGGKDR